MNDFILDDKYDDGVVLTLHSNIRLPRVIMPFIMGCLSTAILCYIAPPTAASFAHFQSIFSNMTALLSVVVIFCFAFTALFGFGQAAIAAFGSQAWQATSGRLEFHQQILGMRMRRRVRGEVILLSKPSSFQSTSWKLSVTPEGGADQFWRHRHIHISSDDDELRTVGKLLSGWTGWRFVDEGIS